MNCREYRRAASRQLDGAIDQTERAHLERHVETCPTCRRFREVALAATSIHRRIVEVVPARDLAPSIVAAALRRHEKAWLGGWLRVAVPAAATVVGMLGIWLGGMLTEHLSMSLAHTRTDVLELEYLDVYPPGSMGDLLAASSAGGEDERD
jgi:anti-sigma factor RsiW